MAKAIVARKGKVRTRSRAPRPRKPTLDEISGHLLRVTSVVMTAVLACSHGEGCFQEVANNLRSHAYFPLRKLRARIEGLEEWQA